MAIWKPLLIDRIHMNKSISSEQNSLYSYAWGQLIEIYELREEILPKGKITIKQGPSWTRIGYYPQKNIKIADIEVGQRYKNRYFKLSLYPSKFAGNDFSYLKDLINGMLPDFDYGKLFFESRVSYIELACDSLTYPAHSFIPYRRNINYSKIFNDNGSKGTTYLGSIKSDLRFRIYDKAKQLMDTSKSSPHKLHTRIESSIRKLKLAPSELLLKLPNPFMKLEISDIAIARSISKDLDWEFFLDMCISEGSAAALASLTKNKRKIFISRLYAARVGWWKPDNRWSGLASALAKIAP
jgi:hypothetical protein